MSEVSNELGVTEEQEVKRDAAIANTLDFAPDTPQHVRDREIERRQKTAVVLGVANPKSMELSIPDEAVPHLPSVVNASDSARKIKPRRFALLQVSLPFPARYGHANSVSTARLVPVVMFSLISHWPWV